MMTLVLSHPKEERNEDFDLVLHRPHSVIGYLFNCSLQISLVEKHMCLFLTVQDVLVSPEESINGFALINMFIF